MTAKKDEYERIEQILEEVEDIVLGRIAKMRLARKGKRTVTLEEAERKVGLRCTITEWRGI